jgi:hypothetical protein
MLTSRAIFFPAMSNAVPWSTDVRKIGIPPVIEMVRSKGQFPPDRRWEQQLAGQLIE